MSSAPGPMMSDVKEDVVLRICETIHRSAMRPCALRQACSCSCYDVRPGLPHNWLSLVPYTTAHGEQYWYQSNPRRLLTSGYALAVFLQRLPLYTGNSLALLDSDHKENDVPLSSMKACPTGFRMTAARWLRCINNVPITSAVNELCVQTR